MPELLYLAGSILSQLNGFFKSFSQAASTLNLLRAFCHGGFADLKKVQVVELITYQGDADDALDVIPDGYSSDEKIPLGDHGLCFPL